MAFKIQGGDERSQDSLQTQIGALKDAFAVLADAALVCAPRNADPKALETQLAKLVDANKPEVQEFYDPDKPPPDDRIYGDDLKVRISPQNHQLILVEFNFGIECGFDSMLLAYEWRDGVWKPALRWQSPAYDDIGGAFGDFFAYQVLPQANSMDWRIAVAHGHPWCTSNMSGLDLDLLQPPVDGKPQEVLSNKKLNYWRDEHTLMKAAPGGFELRAIGLSRDMNVIRRPVIYRFRQDGNSLVRVQPIADNGRDFVDEWLQSPWSDASRWSVPQGQGSLEQTHKSLNELWNSGKAPLFTVGPVRGCSESKLHFQVELDEEWADGKGNSRPGPATYFQIEQGKNSFTMLSASHELDPRCTGPNIMPPE